MSQFPKMPSVLLLYQPKFAKHLVLQKNRKDKKRNKAVYTNGNIISF